MKEKIYSKWMFILFPALAMLLGWGLRGHIGGGPFGAMIPGAMLALSICLLLKLPSSTASIIVVFGIIGIGLGGEMTYGQTLGFLRNSETVMWGTLATTLKGGIWGMLGGAVLSMGFIYRSLTYTNVIVAFLILMTGMILGFKLINEPMIIYFSDPKNPRSESWAALLFGALTLITYLKYISSKFDFNLVFRFAFWGLIGGSLGFGLGGLWFVVGENLPKEIIFHSWWKMMEFTFGFLLGGAFGYAAWLSQEDLRGRTNRIKKPEVYSFKSSYKEIGVAMILGSLIFFIIPSLLEPFVDTASGSDGFLIAALRTIVRIMTNYAFYGFLLIATIMFFPKSAWQVAITLTFCHTVIDLADDHFSNLSSIIPLILISTLLVALLTAYYQEKKNSISSHFLILIWSTVIISTYKITFSPQKMNLESQSFYSIIFGLFIVDIIFLISSVILTWIVLKRFKSH